MVTPPFWGGGEVTVVAAAAAVVVVSTKAVVTRRGWERAAVWVCERAWAWASMGVEVAVSLSVLSSRSHWRATHSKLCLQQIRIPWWLAGLYTAQHP